MAKKRRRIAKPEVPDVKFEVKEMGFNVPSVMSNREDDEELAFAGGGEVDYDTMNEDFALEGKTPGDEGEGTEDKKS